MVKPVSKHRPAGRRTPKDGDTERRILDAAHRVFLRNGTAGARTQEIAAEAGVNSALLHYYFRSKERLATAVFRRAAGELFPVVAGILMSDQPLEEKVRRVISVELDRLSQTPYLPAYVISELAYHPERIHQLIAALTGTAPGALGQTVLATIQAQIRAEVRADRMRPIRAEQFLVNLLSLCIFPFAAQPMLAALLGLDGEPFTRFIRDRKRELPEFFMKALQP
jgi:TetR/AcrR family transcriptional regulator